MSRKPFPDREDFVRLQPADYEFHFKDIPSTKYAKSLDVLFNNPDYSDAVEKRNRLSYKKNVCVLAQAKRAICCAPSNSMTVVWQT